nr:TIGR03089 family protein [Flexivirga meconopsidis]
MALRTNDPGRPLLTWYDDSTGERIELSARTLLNWVAKAGNWLDLEAAAEPGGVLALTVPADHWRAVYWALAGWSRGLTVDLTGGAGDATVGLDTGPAGADLVEPAASLAASPLQAMPDAPPPPVGTFDDSTPAITAARTTYADLSAAEIAQDARVLVEHADAALLATVVRVLLAGGSVVIQRSADRSRRDDRLAAEGVTQVL